LLAVHPNGRINYVGEETTAHGADLGAYAAAVAATRQRKAEERLQEAERGVEEGRVVWLLASLSQGNTPGLRMVRSMREGGQEDKEARVVEGEARGEK
jgi:hypothetical protein